MLRVCSATRRSFAAWLVNGTAARKYSPSLRSSSCSVSIFFSGHHRASGSVRLVRGSPGTNIARVAPFNAPGMTSSANVPAASRMVVLVGE